MATEINLPDIGIDEVEVTEILVKIGDKVKEEQSILTVEGDKASMEIPSPQSGIVKEIKVSIGNKVKTGTPIMVFSSDKEGEKILPVKEKKKTYPDDLLIEVKTKEDKFLNNIYIHATPLIRRMARELNVDLAKVKGTGQKGRILREDIQSYIEKESINYSHTSSSFSSSATDNFIPDMFSQKKIDFRKFGEVEEIELGKIQKISGANLSRNWAMIPHVTHFDKADITELETFRKQKNSEPENHKLGVKITLVPFIIKAVSFALKKMPRFNSSLSENGQRLTIKKYTNIGIAVDTPNGLVVPVIKNTNEKGIIELSRDLLIVTQKARNGKLTSSEMQGGCFTISSIGGLGTTYFSPIINAPEVAILGVSKTSMEPVWNGKEFIPRLMLPISLSFNHSVIDGADGARFITIISSILNDIRCLVM